MNDGYRFMFYIFYISSESQQKNHRNEQFTDLQIMQQKFPIHNYFLLLR